MRRLQNPTGTFSVCCNESYLERIFNFRQEAQDHQERMKKLEEIYSDHIEKVKKVIETKFRKAEQAREQEILRWGNKR